jgi:hypothetical protein
MPDQNDQASLLAFAVHGEKGCKATQWVKNDAEAIIAYIEEQFAQLPHHRGIVLTSAGMMPPGAAPQTIKQVFDWIKRYPHINT